MQSSLQSRVQCLICFFQNQHHFFLVFQKLFQNIFNTRLKKLKKYAIPARKAIINVSATTTRRILIVNADFQETFIKNCCSAMKRPHITMCETSATQPSSTRFQLGNQDFSMNLIFQNLLLNLTSVIIVVVILSQSRSQLLLELSQ